MRRLIEIEKKPQEVADQLLRSHSDNATLVEQANVVLSTAWDQEFTETQVIRK